MSRLGSPVVPAAVPARLAPELESRFANCCLALGLDIAGNARFVRNVVERAEEKRERRAAQ